MRLVQLRNPWGDFEWNGDWSDASELWTQDLKDQVGWTQENDGTFFMSLDDFRRYFNRVQICKVHDEFVYSSVQVDHSAQNWSVFILRLEQDSSELYLNVSQKDQRFFPEGHSYEYSPLKFIFCSRDNDENVHFIGAKSGKGREVFHRFENLQAGEYCVYVQVNWNEETEDRKACLSFYSQTLLEFSRDETAYYDQEEFLGKALSSYAIAHAEEHTFAEQGLPEASRFSKFTDFGFGVIHYRNNSEQTALKEKVDYPTFEGLALLKPFQGAQGYEVEVGPGKSQTVIIDYTSNSGYKMSSSSSVSVEFNENQLIEKARNEGTRKVRADSATKEEVEIYQYTLKHSSGICYFYENLTEDKTLSEDLKFNIEGLYIVGNDEGNTEVKVELGPGESRLVQLKSTGEGGWKIGMSCGYLVQ